MKILVVDDEKIVVDYISNILEKSGFEVVKAYNGKEALEEFLSDSTINIVITDILMPVMSGIELVEKIRENKSNTRTYIIVLTSKTDEETIKQSLEKGADDFLFKPITPVILKVYINKAVRYLNLVDPHILVSIPISLMDSKDKYTTFHSNNVRLYSSILAKLLLSMTNEDEMSTIDMNDFLMNLEIAALLHDVGKISMPDYLIIKPARYTPEEYQLMKKHSTEGAKIFSNLMKKYPNNSLIRICHEVTRWHHERWDGTGYPDGLKGTAIPLTARIVAIADVFDALTTRRSYRNEFTSEEAIKIMTDDENGHFDSHLLEILLKHKKLFTSIAQSRLAAQLDEVRK